MTRIALLVAALAAAGCKDNPGQITNPIHCNTAADCPANLPMCTPDSKICVGCLSDFQTCGPHKTCDDATHMCVPASPDMGCARNADCPRPGVDPSNAFVCQLDAGICVNCLSDSDCAAGHCVVATGCNDAGCNTVHACVLDMGTYTPPSDGGSDGAIPPDASATD